MGKAALWKPELLREWFFPLWHFAGLSNQPCSPAKLDELLQQNWKETQGSQPRTRGQLKWKLRRDEGP